MERATHCYVAIYPGHQGYGMATVDCPEMAKSNAKEIAKCIKDGATIERVTVEEAKAGLLLYLEDRKEKKSNKNQQSLPLA